MCWNFEVPLHEAGKIGENLKSAPGPPLSWDDWHCNIMLLHYKISDN